MFAQVTLEVRPQDTYDLIQLIIDNIEDEYGSTVMDAAGVDQQELFDAILGDATFKKLVIEGVKEVGMEYLDLPYDHADAFHYMETVPGLVKLCDMLHEMHDIIEDAKKDVDVTCIPVPQGYKLVRI